MKKENFSEHLLIAHPKIEDSRFAQAVILIISHTDNGINGVVLNKESPANMKDIISNKIKNAPQVPIFFGGPVFSPILSLHQNKKIGIPFGNLRLKFSVKQEEIEKLVNEYDDTSRFYLGISTWASGQLEKELAVGTWYLYKPKISDIFYDRGQDLHADLMKRIGREMVQEFSNIPVEYFGKSN